LFRHWQIINIFRLIPRKILIVGSNQVWSIEKIYLKYLSALQIETDLFAAQNFFFDYHKGVVKKLIFRFGISDIYQQINQLLLQKVNDYQPDVIWVFKGMEIFPKTIEKLKLSGFKVANYNPDNPFIFSGRGSGNKNVKDSIKEYDLHFTYNKSVQKKIEETFRIKTAYLPFGFDLSEEEYEKHTNQQEIVKVCFLGNPDAERATIINALIKQGISIDLYGNNWHRFVEHSKASIFPPVYGTEFWQVLRRYRIQLNLMRIHNDNSHNMRSFEIPAIGSIMIAPDTPEHRLFFEEKKEIFLFSNLEECKEKINYVIKLNNDEANKIRNAARYRSIISGYSYRERAKFVYETFAALYHKTA
jgi:spore maturation protein CgeB